MKHQIFVSHTKFDADFFNFLDSAEARLGKIRLYRSEYEKIRSPPWLTIREELNKSDALFLLVGKELVKAQTAADASRTARDDWKHTQNWIAYEIGIASQKWMDVWVLCDDVEINFPVPYLNNYALRRDFDLYKKILSDYSEGKKYPTFSLAPTRSLIRHKKTARSCPYDKCRVIFNLHSSVHKGEIYKCPSCLQPIKMTSDFEPQTKGV
jgi:hypothetical protein